MTDFHELSGRTIREWTLIEPIGTGADGIVYSAVKDGEQFALKLFFPETLKKNGYDEGLQRLELQLQLKGKKHHQYLVQIFDGGELPELDTLYVVMELVPGTSLDKVIDKVPREAIPKIVDQLASAAEHLETWGLVHRDIKPANIVISDDFQSATLLDLGIVLATDLSDAGRLSGDEFVATVRYSPPEFVWRTEESGDENAWRAITYYQIGATLHDLIMAKPLFSGHDTPRAVLYDSVKYRTPVIGADDCESWLITLAKSCLVKKWRERVQLVNWDSFRKTSDINDVDHQTKLIRLRQLRHEEGRIFKAEQAKNNFPANGRFHELWDLHNRVFLEIREYLMSTDIYPRFSGSAIRANEKCYLLKFEFDEDDELMFFSKVTVDVQLSIDEEFEQASILEVIGSHQEGEIIFSSKWTEVLTIESTSRLVQNALLQIVSQLVPE